MSLQADGVAHFNTPCRIFRSSTRTTRPLLLYCFYSSYILSFSFLHYLLPSFLFPSTLMCYSYGFTCGKTESQLAAVVTGDYFIEDGFIYGKKWKKWKNGGSFSQHAAAQLKSSSWRQRIKSTQHRGMSDNVLRKSPVRNPEPSSYPRAKHFTLII